MKKELLMIKGRFLLSFVLAFTAMSSYGEMSLFSPSGGIPVDITSDGGIEIDQTNKVITASQNAKVVRDNVTLLADKLYAFYEEDDEGNTVFWRIDAQGNLKIISEQGTITGQEAAYDVKQKIIVIKGHPVIVETAKGTLQAQKQIEYYEAENRIIARGNVHAEQNEQAIDADVIEVLLNTDKQKPKDTKPASSSNESALALSSDVDQIRAYDNITLKNKDATVTGDKGIWLANRQKATLTGKVTLKQKNNILNGCRAEVNTATNSAKIIGGSCDGSGRITGSFESNE